jgi:2-polyprenyl-3-methyl-5-hydroxy-6-metoxy-1,4-benzoquinol methylase
VTAIDLAESLLAVARAEAGSRGVAVTFAVGDASRRRALMRSSAAT